MPYESETRRNAEHRLFGVQCLQQAARFTLDLLLEERDGIHKLFGTRRAPRDVDIYRDHLVHSLHNGVVVEDPARGRAGAHRNYPLRFRHLVIKTPNDRSHFLRYAAGNDHQIRLPRRRAKYFGAKAGNVEARCPHRHHLDRATSESKSYRPHRTLTHPVDGEIQRGEKYAFRLLETVVDFLQFGAILGAAFKRAEQVTIAFLKRPHNSILP